MDVVPLSIASPPEHIAEWGRLDRLFWSDELPGLEPPSLAESTLELTPSLARRPVGLLAIEDGKAIGGYVGSETLLEDTDTAAGWLVVDRGSRRRGVATALLAAAREAHVDNGRKRVESSIREGSAASALCAKAGAKVTQIELCNVLDIAGLPAELDTWAKPAAGYELRTWTDTCPDDLVDAYAAAHSAMHDAPRGTAIREEKAWTAERARDEEARATQVGITMVTTAAVTDDGEVAGYTDIAISGRPTTVIQEDTGVVRAHRGHGLGLTIKAANLQHVMALVPDLRTVVTWNAATNQHMLAVNERFGFRPHSRWEEIELDF
ncbi:MAG TPA: GNAT family N-acetyltransferase [Mycobacteriales bacterium]|nr:GNAT family N-acetyltransferase [Mycobacteriales bacterium]